MYQLYGEDSEAYSVGFWFKEDRSDLKDYLVPHSQPWKQDGGKYLRVALQATSHDQVAAICACRTPEDALAVLEGTAKPIPEELKELPKEEKKDGGKPKGKRGRPKKQPVESSDAKGEPTGTPSNDSGRSDKTDADGDGS